MASINVRLYKYKKKDGTHNLQIVYQHDEKMRRHIGISVRPEQFDKNKGLVYDHPDADIYNQIILKKKQKLRNIYNDILASGLEPFRDRVATKYDIAENSSKPAHELFAWWCKRISGGKSIRRMRDAVKKSLSKYNKQIQSLTLQGMDLKFIDSYINAMTNGKISHYKNGVTNKTLKAYISVIKIFLEDMHTKYKFHNNTDYLAFNRYFSKKYKVVSKDKPIIKDSELDMLKKESDDPTIRRFLFCYYMGCRIGDTYRIGLENFQEDEEGNVFFIYINEKTQEKSVYLLDDEALEYFNKIKSDAKDGQLFYDNLVVKSHNIRLKKICKKLGLNRKVKRTYTKNKEIIEEKLSLYKVLSTHCGRHSFSHRYLKKMNGDVISLRDILGHTSIQTTERNYLKRFKNVAMKRQLALKKKHGL